MGNNKHIRPGRLLLGGILAAILLAAGCSDPQRYYEVMREQRTALQEVADILAGIEDEKTMAAAKEKLEGRKERFEAIARKARALPQPPPEVVQERLQQDAFLTQRALDRYREQLIRVRKLPGGADFLKQFESQSESLFGGVQP
jgi:hypothetical protein